MRILMVDDEVDIRFVTRLMLDPHGHDVTEAGTVAETFSALEGFTPDLILLDIRLPDGDGFDVLQKLRLDERFSGVPVVMLSAHSNPEAMAEATSKGSDGYLVKPFTEVQLTRALESVRKAS